MVVYGKIPLGFVDFRRTLAEMMKVAGAPEKFVSLVRVDDVYEQGPIFGVLQGVWDGIEDQLINDEYRDEALRTGFSTFFHDEIYDAVMSLVSEYNEWMQDDVDDIKLSLETLHAWKDLESKNFTKKKG